MTQLLDSGYLETDDCVVAACFIGKSARFVSWDRKTLSQGLYLIELVTVKGWNSHDYPILVPASTVAEVECGRSGIEPHWLLLCHSVDVTGSQRTLIQWLRKHTQGEE